MRGLAVTCVLITCGVHDADRGIAAGTSASPSSVTASAAVHNTSSAGSKAVGAATYPISGASIFVSPSGNDSWSGSKASPVRTVKRAIALAPPGSTVVMRSGSYHETVEVSGKRLTLQNYPGEAVWFDGSSPVTGWQRSGAVWRRAGWTSKFDHSPTFTFGAPDSTTPGWSFVNADHPMAAHPDQLWIDGTAMRQVKSLNQVAPGTFFFDEPANALYVGSNPVNHSVRASDLAKAISVRAAGSVLRGFGVRDYATSVPYMGTVTIERQSVTLENVVVQDNASSGIFVGATDVTLRSVTVQRNGLIGVLGTYADRLRVDSLLSRENNTEAFNTAPVAGGIKIGRTRSVSITASAFEANNGTGAWFDESTYDVKFIGNDSRNNTTHGLSLEISAKALVADNLIAGNLGNGIKVNDTSGVQLWNNTFVANGRPLNIVQDGRLASRLSTPGHDPRQSLPDPTMTWLVSGVTIRNNVLGSVTPSANCLLCVEDYSHARSAATMGVTSNGNVFERFSGRPNWIAVWSTGAGNPQVFTSLAAFSSASGQDRSSRLYDGRDIATPAGLLASDVRSAESLIAQPLPVDVANAIGVTAGTRRLGSWAG